MGWAADSIDPLSGYLEQLADELDICLKNEQVASVRVESARKAAEAIVRIALEAGESPDTLSNLRGRLNAELRPPKRIDAALLAIQSLGGESSHVRGPRAPDHEESWEVCRTSLAIVANWLVRRLEGDPRAARAADMRRVRTSAKKLARRHWTQQWWAAVLIVAGLGVLIAIDQQESDAKPTTSPAIAVESSTEVLHAAADAAPDVPATAVSAVFVDIRSRKTALAVQTTEATLADFRACLRDGACDAMLPSSGRDPASLPELCSDDTSADDLPVVCLDPAQAEALCQYLGNAVRGAPGRVPTAREWEVVTNWSAMHRRHWADTSGASKCLPNLCDRAFLAAYPNDPYCTPRSANATACDDGAVGPAPVPTKEPPTPAGLHDVLGNVAELARDGDAYVRMGRAFRVALTPSSRPRLGAVNRAEPSPQTGVRCVIDLE